MNEHETIGSFDNSFVTGTESQPIFSVAKTDASTSVASANVATLSCDNKIVVTAEIHEEPAITRSVPDMTKSVSNKEQDVVKTTARTYGKSGRVAHVSLSPVRDTGPCVRRHSLLESCTVMGTAVIPQ